MKKFFRRLTIFSVSAIISIAFSTGCGSSGTSGNPGTTPDDTISTSDPAALSGAITIPGSSKVTGILPESTSTTNTPVIEKIAQLAVTAGEVVVIPVFLGDPVISKSGTSKAIPDISCIYVQIQGSEIYWKITQFTVASDVVYFSFTMPAQIEAGEFKLIIQIENSTSQISAPVEQTITVTDYSGTEIALPVGDWVTPSIVYGTGDDGIYTTADDLMTSETYDFSEGNKCMIYRAFAAGDNSLSKTYALYTYYCTYVVGDLAGEPEGARKIDITQTSVTLMLTDSDLVAEANTNNYCGYSDWVLYKEKDISGKEFKGKTEFPNGNVLYSVYSMPDGKLYLGDDKANPEYDGSSDSKRPRVLYDVSDPEADDVPTLEGTWGSYRNTTYSWYDFGLDGEDETGDDMWRKATVEINGDTMTLIYDFAYGASAGSLTHYATYRRTHTFVTGGPVDGTSGDIKIDLTQTAATYTITNSYWIDRANLTSLYGYNDWVINTTKDIVGRTNSAEGITEAVNGTVIYSRYHLYLKTLKLGGEDYDLPYYDGTTDEKRHFAKPLNLYRLKD